VQPARRTPRLVTLAGLVVAVVLVAATAAPAGAAATTPTVSIADTSVVEGDGGTVSASFTVTMSAASADVVTVDYTTVNGTAKAPGDYAADLAAR
jgi:hypothetical protein